ncbi:MAG: hypothetical protein ACI9UJ_002550 [bacterium]|jgi:hypothetical protein
MNKLLLRLFITWLLSGSYISASGQNNSVNIHINSGQLKTIDSTFLSVKCFNATDSFAYNSQVFIYKFSDSIVVQLFNNDSISHTVSIQPYVQNKEVKAMQTASFVLKNVPIGDYRVEVMDIIQSYLGLSALLSVVGPNEKTKFFWNLKEFQSTFNQAIGDNQNVDFDQYAPNYFLINGKSFPEIELDTQAKIRGYVNDTLYVTILNSGEAIHPLHFHGFHFKVVYSSLTPEAEGRVKDTYAVWSGELVTLEIVPDKPGEYPIHSHNLVAVSANNIYPNGMFTTMVILK